MISCLLTPQTTCVRSQFNLHTGLTLEYLHLVECVTIVLTSQSWLPNYNKISTPRFSSFHLKLSKT